MLKMINISEIVVAILLIISILMQQRGSGLGAISGDSWGGYYTKRGFERFLVYFSIILSILFVVLAIANLIVSNKLS